MNYEYCAGVTYTIKNGDTLYEISRRHGVPLALLLRANPYVDVFSLQAGDTICIPQKTKEELPYPMESPMQDSMEDSMGESEEDSMENNIRRAAGKTNSSAGMQDGMPGNSRSTGMQAGMQGNNSSAGMQAGMQGNNSSAGMQDGMPGSNSPAGMPGGMTGNNNSTRMQAGMPEQNSTAGMQRNVGMDRMAGQRADNEQMDEMLVWSEQADLNRGKKGGSTSSGKQWCKYVIKPGDTLEDVFKDMDDDMDEFWERNPASQIYLLPGVVCHVCKNSN